MTIVVRRALCAAAGLLAFAGASAAAAPATMTFAPLGSPDHAAITQVDDGLALAAPSSASLVASEVTSSVSLITGLDLELGYKVDLAGRIAPIDMSSSHVFDGLFLSASAAGPSYGALADGGSYFAASTTLARGLHFGVALSSVAPGMKSTAPDAFTALQRLGGTPEPYAARSADALLAGVSWQPSDWASLGLTGSQTTERNAILGNAAPGTASSTAALGVSARVRLGGGWSTTASYGEGMTQVDLRSGLNAVPLTGDGLHTRSYGIAIAKNGLFGDDTLGIAVSHPALAGNGEFITMSGAGNAPSLLGRGDLLQSIGPSHETDVEIGYITTFLDGSLALQTNASFQMNYAGQNGQNAVSLLSRARIKF